MMKERLQQAKLCLIIIDEMAISSMYIYDCKMDRFFGQQTPRSVTERQGNVNNAMLVVGAVDYLQSAMWVFF